MNRRDFIGSAVLTSLLTQLQPLVASATTDGATQVSLPFVIDNDEAAAALDKLGLRDEQLQVLLDSGSFNQALLQFATVPKTYLPFEEVISYISPFLEKSFDSFLFANCASTGSQADLVRYQHLVMVRRAGAGLPIFERNSKGRIMGLSSSAEVMGEFPISTGVGSSKGIRTFSGIFRFDHQDMKNKFNTSPEADMSYQSYIDFRYTGGSDGEAGRDSGVAIHGTPTKFRKYLGVQPASHGCMRTDPKFAKLIRSYLMSSEMWSESIPAFDNTALLPSQALMNGQVHAKPGIKALMVIFQGYSKVSKDV